MRNRRGYGRQLQCRAQTGSSRPSQAHIFAVRHFTRENYCRYNVQRVAKEQAGCLHSHLKERLQRIQAYSVDHHHHLLYRLLLLPMEQSLPVKFHKLYQLIRASGLHRLLQDAGSVLLLVDYAYDGRLW